MTTSNDIKPSATLQEDLGEATLLLSGKSLARTNGETLTLASICINQ